MRILFPVLLLLFADLRGLAQTPADDLARYMEKLTQRAAELGDARLDEYWTSEFGRNVTLGQNLAERGRYSEAADVYRNVLSGEMANDWRQMLGRRLAIAEKWAASGVTSLADYKTFFLEIGAFQDRLRPIASLWTMEGIDETEQLRLLHHFFEVNEDKEGVPLVLEALSVHVGASEENRANALLKLGNFHYQARDFGRAERTWLKLSRQFPGTPTWGKAVFNLGISHKDQSDFEGAIGYFTSLLDSDVNDLEPGGNIMEPYRNYRPRAQWQIAHSLFAQGKYRDALNAYRVGETRYPMESWCGNELGEYAYQSALYQALSHDWLGETREAVRLYFLAAAGMPGPAASRRIVDLYSSAGRRQELLGILDSWDRGHVVAATGNDRSGILRLTRPSARSGVVMRRMIELRDEAERGNWEALAQLLRIRGTTAGPENGYARRENWEAVEAARLLGAHPDSTENLLLARLGEADAHDRKWIFYALGLCGTKRAVARLQALALEETNGWWTNSVVYGLSLAGPQGRQAIDKLEFQAEGSLKWSIQHYREGRLGDGKKDPLFPPAEGRQWDVWRTRSVGQTNCP